MRKNSARRFKPDPAYTKKVREGQKLQKAWLEYSARQHLTAPNAARQRWWEDVLAIIGTVLIYACYVLVVILAAIIGTAIHHKPKNPGSPQSMGGRMARHRRRRW